MTHRALLHRSFRRALALGLYVPWTLACSSDDTGGGGTAGEACEIPPEGSWNPVAEDWRDVGEPGHTDMTEMCGQGSVIAHHCFLTTVHAVHLHTNEILMMHGQSDQRLWHIGDPPDSMTWHPVGPQTTWEVIRREGDTCGEDSLPCCAPGEDWCHVPRTGWPDLFCSGHVQLADGTLLMGGGNVTGSPTGGGLDDLFRFIPGEAVSPFEGMTTCGFGWEVEPEDGAWQNPLPKMTYDRWYPTLTALGDGRVLISGGESRGFPDASTGAATAPPILEVFNPTSGAIGTTPALSVVPLTNAPFPSQDASGIPNYPFMFLLPNGDVFYAGSENAFGDAREGRILISDVNSMSGDWVWEPHQFTSTINGGSAVMYQPGKILKTGGGNSPLARAEYIDLSIYPAADYAGAPAGFTVVANPADQGNPEYARHFHNLTLLPDGRVVALGGNSSGNSNPGDHHNNPCCIGESGTEPYPCEPEEQAVDQTNCTDGCPSECIQWNAEIDPACVPSEVQPTYRCSLLAGIVCDCEATDEPSCESRPNCEWSNGACAEQMTPNAFCDAVMDGASCDNGRCRKDCTGLGDVSCTDVEPVEGVCVAPTLSGGKCSPQNNACYAQKAAEVWDPTCNDWTTLDAQAEPRMYHSTALLIPDGRVISMGGGHRDFSNWTVLEEQASAEYFEPVYSVEGASKPTFTSVPSTLPWNGEIEVVLGDDVTTVTRATLVRLGSTTHGFDMDQRFIELEVDGAGTTRTIHGVTATEEFHSAQNIAPPGYYMLFLFDEGGEPSVGHYVKVGVDKAMQYVCPVSSGLVITETSCTAEPSDGACPAGATTTNSLSAPRIDGPMGTVSGFYAFADYDVVHDPFTPRPDELAKVRARCVESCQAFFADQDGVDATCDVLSAFGTPVAYDPAKGALDLMRDDERHGEGIFAGQSLACDLGTDCHESFDEHLARAVPNRASAADAVLAEGEEYVVALGARSRIDISTSAGTYTSALTGRVGYSECRDGNDSGPCPFYLGSLTAAASSAMSIRMQCDDGSQDQVRLDNLLFSLAQPAFGIAKGGSQEQAKGFPAGALIVQSAFDVDGEHHRYRKPNRFPVTLTAAGEAFAAENLIVEIDVPCNGSTTSVVVTLTLADPGDGSALAKPPEVEITTPSSVACGVTGTPVALTAVATDPDGDLGSVRWTIDGVLMSPSTSSLTFTRSHMLEVVARDSRGAATTDRRMVECL